MLIAGALLSFPSASVSMSSGSRRASQFLQEKEDEVPQWIPGLGADKPKPRTLGTSFFGYVPDAFVEKTPFLPSEKKATTPKVRRGARRAPYTPPVG